MNRRGFFKAIAIGTAVVAGVNIPEGITKKELTTAIDEGNKAGHNYLAMGNDGKGGHNVVTYIGTGKAGHTVDFGLDMTGEGSYVMVKSMDEASSWNVLDNKRG